MPKRDRHHCPLVTAEETRDALQGNRIDVPCIARDVADLVHVAVVWRMESMVHARREPQRDVGAVAVALAERRVGNEIVERVVKPLGLDERRALDAPGGADDRVTWADEHALRPVHGTRAGLQFTHEAIVQARKPLLSGLVQVEVAGEELPDGN